MYPQVQQEGQYTYYRLSREAYHLKDCPGRHTALKTVLEQGNLLKDCPGAGKPPKRLFREAYPSLKTVPGGISQFKDRDERSSNIPVLTV